MKDIVNKLLTVKSIVTLMVTTVFCILSLRQTISGEHFFTIFNIIIAFYFGTQSEKKNNKVSTTEQTKENNE